MSQNSVWKKVTLQFDPSFPTVRQDLSAIHLSRDGNLWLGCDEGAALERLSSSDGGNSFGNHEHFKVNNYIELPVSDATEVDIEGLAEADHYLWLVGSHSCKRKNPKPDRTDAENIKRLATIESEANRYLLARIPLIEGKLYATTVAPTNEAKTLTAAHLETTHDGNLLTEALKEDPHLGTFIKSNIPSKDNGFDVEGLAVSHDRIFLGLRGPVLRGWAILLELAVEVTSPHLLKLKKIGQKDRLYKKYFLNLQGLGIREISIEGDDLLILAGPTMSLDGPVKIFRFVNGMHLGDNSLCKPQGFMNIPYGEGTDHAEGITQFKSIAGQSSLLVVYDSPDPTRLVGKSDILADVFKAEWQAINPQSMVDSVSQ